MRFRRVFGTGVILSLLVATFLTVQPTNAAVARPANGSEKAAKAWADKDISNNACSGPYGAMWISADNNRDPFNLENNIKIDYNQEKVFVRLRGSLYSRCNRAQTGYATNIRQGSGSNGWRLGNLATRNQAGRGARFRRGTVGAAWTASASHWTSEADTMTNYVRMELDVSGLVSPGETETIGISLYRCYNSMNSNLSPEGIGCKDEDYRVTITRGSEPKWQAEARSFVKKSNESGWGTASRTISAKVGETIDFQHSLATANGGSVTGDKINWTIRASENYAGGNQGTAYQGSGSPNNQGQATQSNGVFLRSGISNTVSPGNNSRMSYTIQPSDAGKRICQRIEFTPTGRNSPGVNNQYQDSGNTKWACAYVAYNYELTPTVPLESGCTGSCNKEVEPGTPDVSIPPVVIYPPNQAIKNTSWKLTSFVVRPNQTIPGATSPNSDGFKTLNGDSCSAEIYNRSGQVYQPNENNSDLKIKNCTVEQTGEINHAEFGSSGKLPINLQDSLKTFSVPESAEVGTKYCFALSVSPYRMSDRWGETNQNSFADWYHGKPGCIIVVKKPKTQVLGGGLFAEEGAYGLTSTRNDRLFGSWVEYEIVANNDVNSNVASSSVFASPDSTIGFNGPGSNTPQRQVQNYLTFANTNPSGNIGSSSGAVYGNFGRSMGENLFTQMKNHYSNVSSTSSASSISGELASDRVYKPNAEVQIGSSAISSDATIVVYAPDRTVNVDGDVINNGAAGSSQMIIIAKRIMISGEVSRIDSWLLAEEINTCARENGVAITADNIREGVCENKLEVNGPVSVAGSGNSLKLRRTAGSVGAGDNIGSPAEVFNLPPSVYNWLVKTANSDGRITTSYTKELPVRF